MPTNKLASAEAEPHYMSKLDDAHESALAAWIRDATWIGTRSVTALVNGVQIYLEKDDTPSDVRSKYNKALKQSS